ncbi:MULTISPECIES: AEC family transporter [unclassified Sporosarcina]|uniref:AEC family transporter n=1 Tax=unclassified Sporosarcina TaxID=2647733 RepID=UPI0020407435|nr:MULTISPECIES: AEC family transporter [unclassified Sporosarcina]GKV65622.1 transporter [Sporosarcina sp. NCCP-2331]GLB55798.1 transporter [Sporosarcina sp. NCCP-2378]
MGYLLIVFVNVITPMLILLAIGVILQIKFTFNVKALGNILTYCLIPAAVFMNLYHTVINIEVLLDVLFFVILFSSLLIVTGHVFSKMLRLNRQQSAVMKNSIVLINSGNYGLPVSQLVFHSSPLGVSIQIIIIVYQNLLTYSYGLFNLVSSTQSGISIVKQFIKMPIIHALWIGALLNLADIRLPNFIELPVSHLSDAFIAIALITLGAQLAQIKVKTLWNRLIFLSAFGRLILSPAIALLLILLLKIDGVTAQSLWIASCFPTSRNSSTLALEYDVEAELAAQIVLFTTIASSFTVGIVIYLSSIIFV